MRIYKDFPEAFGEIRRDLKEMGVNVNNVRMQDKHGSFPTLELRNYGYTVLEPRLTDLNPVQPWADAEWKERLSGIQGRPVNPGEAYKLRTDYEHIKWEDYIDPKTKRFSYSYGERFCTSSQVLRLIRELQKNPLSRQLYISLWDTIIDPQLMSRGLRVPCSIGWQLLVRDDKLHMTYKMRSCDFVTHFQNDIYLSMKLWEFIGMGAKIPLGDFSQIFDSLHVYEKDVKDVF